MRSVRHAVLALAVFPGLAVAQPIGERVTLWGLFEQSLDFFTVLLVIGSVYAVGLIVRCVLEVRGGRVLPARSVVRAEELIEAERWRELRDFARQDGSMVGVTLRAALEHPGMDKAQMRDAAELAASEECARWFRKVEPLAVLGNLGPLLGLAGTVWGMIIAFTSLGATGGDAGPSELSAGIAKALFHTLLGLLLAIPCLTAHGFFKARVDRVCNRGLVVVGSMVDRLPAFKAKKKRSRRSSRDRDGSVDASRDDSRDSSRDDSHDDSRDDSVDASGEHEPPARAAG